MFVGPLKRVKKRYLNDSNIAVPRRTLFWQASRAKRFPDEKQERVPFHIPSTEASDSNQGFNSENSDEGSTSPLTLQESSPLMAEEKFISNGGSLLDQENNEQLESSDSEESNLELSFSQSDTCTELSTDSSDSSSSESESESSDDITENEEEESESNKHFKFTAVQLQSLAMIAFLLRHNLTGVAFNDLLDLIKVVCPGMSELENLKHDDLFQVIDDVNFNACHYCTICHNVFPTNPDIFSCETPECSGLRYKGGLTAQTKPNRLPRQFFLVSDLKSQLKYLLEQDGLLGKIFDTKKRAKNAKISDSSILSDITDGNYYRHLLDDGQFLSNENCISGIFNTDGIPLYKSAHVKLWPIFLAINEIPLRQRFARENMVLVGIWQSKGSPSFLQYMNKFGEEMCSLFNEGISVNRGSTVVTIKLGIFLGIVDL